MGCFVKYNQKNNFPKTYNIFNKKHIFKKSRNSHYSDINSFLFSNNIIYLGLPISEKVNELILIELITLTFLNKKKNLSLLINSNCEQYHYYPYQYSHINLITCIDYINRNFKQTETVVVGKSLGSSIYFLTTINNNQRFGVFF